jgi:hypothetical protein
MAFSITIVSNATRFQALVRDRARGAACLDRLGQQPLHSFGADALAPAGQG